jgi:hypothetical protein
VGCRIDVVDEPGLGTHSGADPEGVVLASDEGLEVVVDDGFRQPDDVFETPRM